MPTLLTKSRAFPLVVSAVLVAVSGRLVGSSSTALGADTKSKAQITQLVEPIALYPDPLLQQLLPAATFPDQIADAALLIRTKADAELIKEQDWDHSVKVIATYAGVLKIMYQRLDWTTELGEVFLNQHQDVLDQIQALRAKAASNGNLETSPAQTVSKQQNESKETIITVMPTDPEVIHVPQETTSAVYREPVDTSNVLVPMAAFGMGMALGSAHNDDDGGENYYYGGPWGGSMWVASEDSFDDWADMRHERYEDRHDERMNRQELRGVQHEDRQDYRQGWAKANPEKAQQVRQNLQTNRAQRTEAARGDQAERQQKLSEARAGMQSHGFNTDRAAAGASARGSQNFRPDQAQGREGFGTEQAQRRQTPSEEQGGLQSFGFDNNQARAGSGALGADANNAQRRDALQSHAAQPRQQFSSTQPARGSSGFVTGQVGGASSWSGQGGQAFANRSSSRGSASRSSMGGGARAGGGSGGGARGGGGRGRR